MKSKAVLGLLLLVFTAGLMAILFTSAAVPVDAAGRAAPTPTPRPLAPARVGSNASLAIGALLLVVIILFGVMLNLRRKK